MLAGAYRWLNDVNFLAAKFTVVTSMGVQGCNGDGRPGVPSALEGTFGQFYRAQDARLIDIGRDIFQPNMTGHAGRHQVIKNVNFAMIAGKSKIARHIPMLILGIQPR